MSLIDIRRKPEVREDFVPVDAYVSREYVELERKRLWPRVWLFACREEEVAKVGDYVTFDIGDESFVVIRSDVDTIKAFYNVCQHRGRRLKDGYAGNSGKQFVCNFHGWRYRLSGEVLHIVDEQDWAPCPQFDKDKLGLKPVRMEAWAGWVWVTMDPDTPPLREFLAPIPEMTAPYELEKLRIGWFQSITVPCNWKVAVDAFNEAYHVFATHSMADAPVDSHTKAYGLHGAIINPFVGDAPDAAIDIRQAMLATEDTLFRTAHSMATPESVRAAEALQGLPQGTPNTEIYDRWLAYFRELLEAKGGEWPTGLTREFFAASPTYWHLFPNCVFVPTVDATLWHRMRPNGDDPASCIWDIWALVRPTSDDKPFEREVYPSPDEFRGQNPFLEEDFSNMAAVQKGMLSRGFEGARTNPLRETTVSHFHRTLYDYLHN